MTNETMTSPLLALRGILVFPSIVLHLDVGREKSIASLEMAMMGDQTIFLSSQKEVAIDDPKPEDIYRVGTIAKISQMLKLPNGTIRVLVEGLERAEIIRYVEEEKEYIVEIKKLEDIHGDEHEEEALMRQLISQFGQYIKVSRKVTKETLATVQDIEEPSRLTFMISSHLPIKIKDKQELLEFDHVIKRMQHLLKIITNEKKILR